MAILNPWYNLVEHFASLILVHALFLNNIVKQLPLTQELHDQEQVFRWLNDFIELDDVGVTDKFQDMDFPRNPLDISNVDDFVLL